MRDEHYAGDDRLIDIDDLKEKIIDSGRALDVLERRGIVAAGQTDRDEVQMRNGHRGEADPSCGWNRTKGTFIDRADESYNGSLIDVIAHTDGLSLPDQLPAVCKIIADELGIELLRMDGTPYDCHGAAAIDPAERARRAEQRRTEVEQRRAERQAKADKEAAQKAQRFATKILPTHWDNAVPALDHPLADGWANMRGIPPRTLDDPNVRIAEDLPFQKFGKYPTIVGSMRKDGPTGDITGLAVIRFEALPGGGVNLNPRFEHRETREVITRKKQCEGTKAGGVWLGPMHGDTLVQTEGLEDTLCARHFDYSAVSKMGIGFNAEGVPDHIKTMILCEDHETNGTGQKAVLKGAAELNAAGYIVRIARIPTGTIVRKMDGTTGQAKDLNDLFYGGMAPLAEKLLANAPVWEPEQPQTEPKSTQAKNNPDGPTGSKKTDKRSTRKNGDIDGMSAKEFALIAKFSDPETGEDDQKIFLKKLDDECTVLTSGGKVMVIHREWIDTLVSAGLHKVPARRLVMERYRPSDFFMKWQNAYFSAIPEGSEKPKRFDLARLWFDNKYRPECNVEKFLPDYDAPKRTLNLWRGWGVEPAPGDWSLLHGHIQDNLCNGEIALFAWTIDWIADMFQNPMRKPGTALIFRGLKGVGKTKLAEWLEYIVGQHSIQCNSADQVSGRFNGHLADKLLIVADEATWGGNKTSVGTLNVLVTGTSIKIERKGENIVDLPSYHRMIVTSNEAWTVQATRDERRYVVYDVGDGKRRDRTFFAAMDEQMLNGGAAAMMHDLKHRKITHDVGDAPKTKGLGAQIAEGMNPAQHMMVRLAWEGRLTDRQGNVVLTLSEDKASIPCQVLTDAIAGRTNGRYSQRDFGEARQEAGFTRRRFRVAGNLVWHYEAPPHDVVTANLEKSFGHPLHILAGQKEGDE